MRRTSSLREMSLKMPCVASLNWMRTSTLPSLSAAVSRDPSHDAHAHSIRLTLSGLHDERDALPSRVVDPQGHGGVGGADRVFGHSVVIVVARLVAVGRVLAEQDILLLDRRDTSQHLDLGMSNDVEEGGQVRTFSSRTSSAENETGRSIASTESV